MAITPQNGATPPTPQPPAAYASPSALDRVLIHLDDAQKSRVLQLVVRLGIDQDDPLWLVSLALGQLTVIAEDAPAHWQDLFNDFHSELTAWTQTNLQTLELVAEKGETMQRLSQTSTQLATSLQHLVTACNALTLRLSKSDTVSHALSQTLTTFSIQTRNGFSELNITLSNRDERLTRQLTALESVTKGARRAARRAMWLSTIAFIFLLGVGWQQQQLTKQMQTLTQQSEWQLSNILHMACTFGAKPETAPECH
ncbi:MAG: hypothetical protein F6J97_18960 [Leptolyngbya sp. SIO4C1]|nr:hypothetical protein [Leptolyngbya sp. SIO4C1]